MPPVFSVVVPAYNAERTLPATLASIAAQTLADHEVIVVDDGSKDGTGALADGLVSAERGRVVHQVNGGLPAARNAGIAAAQGRYVAFLDADDLWLPTYLERMLELLATADDIGFVYCDAWIYDDRRRRIARRSAYERYRPAVVPTESRPFYLAMLHESFVGGGFTCVPRTVFEDTGGFDERLRASEDWNMLLRILATGRRAAGTPERLAVYRHSAGQMHADLDRMWTGQRDAIRSVLERADLDEELRAATEERAQRSQRIVDAGGNDPLWRRTIRPLVNPTRGVKDFRRRPPAEVADAFPDLFG